jgi:hypothetical protein
LTKLSHSGSISFLIKTAKNANDIFYANFFNQLVDKTFYLQVSLWWENAWDPETPENKLDRIAFTGLCHGGQYVVENNKEVLNCTLHDYSKILQDQVFFNSPFYDRMTDIFAIDEILKLAGLRNGSDNGSAHLNPALL